MTHVRNQTAKGEVTGYIVRARPDTRLGLPKEVLGRFATEADARQAFLDLRLSPAYRHGWAELVAVGNGRTPVPLCWFGDLSPSGAPPSPLHGKGLRTTKSHPVQVDNHGGNMQTKEQERSTASTTDPDRPRRGRRAVAALVAVLAAVTLAIGAAAGYRGDDTPSDRPVPTWQIVPAQPTDLPYYGSTADG